jgi:hypothetical protein
MGKHNNYISKFKMVINCVKNENYLHLNSAAQHHEDCFPMLNVMCKVTL